MEATAFITAITEDAINKILRLDPATLQRLGEFDNNIICLQLIVQDSDPLEFYVRPFAGGLRMSRDGTTPADVTIRGNIPVFARMIFGEAANAFVGQADIQIRGDIELGQKFKQVFEQLEIDWEQHSSRFLGDILAHRLGRLARGLRSWKTETWSTFQQDFAEYVQEEATLVPNEQTINKFFRAIDEVHADFESLRKRVQQLQENL